MPNLPGLTDKLAELGAVIRAAADHGATRVISGALRLAPGVKEWFLDYLHADFPKLVESYERGYGRGAEVPVWYRRKLSERVGVASQGVYFSAAAPRSGIRRIGSHFTLPR
jgi:DNA repair photolyase